MSAYRRLERHLNKQLTLNQLGFHSYDLCSIKSFASVENQRCHLHNVISYNTLHFCNIVYPRFPEESFHYSEATRYSSLYIKKKSSCQVRHVLFWRLTQFLVITLPKWVRWLQWGQIIHSSLYALFFLSTEKTFNQMRAFFSHFDMSCFYLGLLGQLIFIAVTISWGWIMRRQSCIDLKYLKLFYK